VSAEEDVVLSLEEVQCQGPFVWHAGDDWQAVVLGGEGVLELDVRR